MEQLASFEAPLHRFINKIYYYHFKVPDEIVQNFKENNIKRCLCTINDLDPIHSGLLPAGDGTYYIIVNKELRAKSGLADGDMATIRFYKDESDYGIEAPEEMLELFVQDPVFDNYFHALTPGKRRALLYAVNKIKSPQLRVEKALIIMEHLQEQRGKLDFKILSQDFKDKKGMLR
ncbi:MAG: YdeI/OmpD-associated family protein [Bacteroidota bacterium]